MLIPGHMNGKNIRRLGPQTPMT